MRVKGEKGKRVREFSRTADYPKTEIVVAVDAAEVVVVRIAERQYRM